MAADVYPKFLTLSRSLTDSVFNHLHNKVKTVLDVSTRIWPIQEESNKNEQSNKKINNKLRTLKRIIPKEIFNVNLDKKY